jgi:hypothetical protein
MMVSLCGVHTSIVSNTSFVSLTWILNVSEISLFSANVHFICSGMVYDDAEKLYAEVREVCTGVLEEAFSILFPQSSPLLSPSKCETIVAFNPTSFERHDVVKVPLSGNVARLKAQVVQASPDGKYGYALMHSRGNGIVAQPTGMFANCAPASGVSHVCRCLCVHTEHPSKYIPMEQTTSSSETTISS